jgi:predicted XRE-type DNA-binding protein
MTVTRGSGNLFADLGFKDAEELEAKAGLTYQLSLRIKHLKLTQAEAASRLGISQPDVSKLMNGRYTGFSIDRLIALLKDLAVDVDISLKPRRLKKASRGVVRVVLRGSKAA